MAAESAKPTATVKSNNSQQTYLHQEESFHHK